MSAILFLFAVWSFLAMRATTELAVGKLLGFAVNSIDFTGLFQHVWKKTSWRGVPVKFEGLMLPYVSLEENVHTPGFKLRRLGVIVGKSILVTLIVLGGTALVYGPENTLLLIKVALHLHPPLDVPQKLTMEKAIWQAIEQKGLVLVILRLVLSINLLLIPVGFIMDLVEIFFLTKFGRVNAKFAVGISIYMSESTWFMTLLALALVMVTIATFLCQRVF